MKDSKTSKSKKGPEKKKTSSKKVVIKPDEKKDVKVDNDFGLHPAEVEDEISQSPKKHPFIKREQDVKVQVKELPEPVEREEEVEDVEPIEDKDFGLLPDEYETEIAELERRRKAKLPVLEKDAPLTTRNVDPERKDDE